MSEIQHYPKWLYHKTEPAQIVQTKDEHEALGKHWQETPVAIDQEQVSTQKKSKADKDQASKGES